MRLRNRRSPGVQKLEDGLGARLLDRTTRSQELTAIGQQFLASARRTLAQFSESVSDIRDVITLKGGRVSVAGLMTVSAYLLPQVVERFSAAFPGVRVRIFDATGAEIPEHVRRGEAEFAIDMQSNEAGRGLVFTPILYDGFVLACHKDHALAGAAPIEWQVLAGMPVISMGKISAIGQLLGDRWSEDGCLAGSIEVQHISTLTAFLEAGLGVGVMPSLATQMEGASSLCYRPLIEPDISRTIGIIEKIGGTLSPAAAEMKKIVLDVARMLPGYCGV
ncbi:MAG: LysR family transcriptional regulator [Proteobacteria bacterium]|nr:LysR family transcriptional regulator [Pseudomonadota bacterium]